MPRFPRSYLIVSSGRWWRFVDQQQFSLSVLPSKAGEEPLKSEDSPPPLGNEATINSGAILAWLPAAWSASSG